MDSRIKRLHKQSARWAGSRGKDRSLYVRRQQQLRKKLRTDRIQFRGAAAYLGGLADHHAMFAQWRILDGDPDGWVELDQSLRYHELEARIFGPPIYAFASWVGHASLMGDDEFVAWSSRRIGYPVPNNMGFFWGETPFPLFAFRLVSLQLEIAPPPIPPLPDPSPYAPLLTHLFDENISHLLPPVCEQHLQQALVADGPADFQAGYQLFPVEILWLKQLRAAKGLETACDHDLMRTPMADFPSSPSRWDSSKDELFNQLTERARELGCFDDSDWNQSK